MCTQGELAEAWAALGRVSCVLEGLVAFEREPRDGARENPYTIQQDLQTTMNDLVGIIRTREELAESLAEIEKLKERAGLLVVEGHRVIEGFRALAGATDPTSALPGTIRGDLGRDWGLPVQQNLVHGSDSASSASREIKLWFPAL